MSEEWVPFDKRNAAMLKAAWYCTAKPIGLWSRCAAEQPRLVSAGCALAAWKV